LAENVEMRDVWTNLPPWFVDHEDHLVDNVIFAFQIATSVSPPPPRKKSEFAEYQKQHRLYPASAEGIATTAQHLLGDMRELEEDARYLWDDRWPGDRSVTFDGLVALMEHVSTFYQHLAEARSKAIIDLLLPLPPRKRGAQRAQQTYFSRIMSIYFEIYCRRPMDALIETLTNIAFDLKGEMTPGTARSRRRSAPAHSRKIST
jgi:hypothetical protein